MNTPYGFEITRIGQTKETVHADSMAIEAGEPMDLAQFFNATEQEEIGLDLSQHGEMMQAEMAVAMQPQVFAKTA